MEGSWNGRPWKGWSCGRTLEGAGPRYPDFRLPADLGLEFSFLKYRPQGGCVAGGSFVAGGPALKKVFVVLGKFTMIAAWKVVEGRRSKKGLRGTQKVYDDSGMEGCGRPELRYRGRPNVEG